MRTQDVTFLDESLPALDEEEMEELYRHFLVDDMPEDDDGDEDFEPPLVDEEEEGEEAGIRRRNIQARELNDLVQDAYKQLGSSAISPGLRERVLDQLSMHFQLLIQTGILAAKATSNHQYRASLGMLEHLAYGSGKTGKQARRTRAWGKINAVWCDPDCEDLFSLGVPGLSPFNTLRVGLKVRINVFRKREFSNIWCSTSLGWYANSTRPVALPSVTNEAPFANSSFPCCFLCRLEIRQKGGLGPICATHFRHLLGQERATFVVPKLQVVLWILGTDEPIGL
ncbi:unnamed protein product [Scytosiphon promiscuus]